MILNLEENFYLSELLKVLGTLTFFFSVFVLAEYCRVYLKVPVEWSRKLVHVAIGVVVSCFHWIFSATWAVGLLAVLMFLFMALSRKMKWFSSIHGVERRSFGDLYYIISAIVLFTISSNNPVLYFISILTLTVSDALAALVGTTYQKLKFSVEDHYKSFEGSLIFFLSTFLIVQIPLLLLTNTDRLHCILVALQIAILVTCLEAICLNGLDNLLVPMGTYFLLYQFLKLTTSYLQQLILWQIVILVITFILGRRSRLLSMSGVLATQIFIFGTFNFGDPTWVVPEIIGLSVLVFFYMFVQLRAFQKMTKKYQVMATFYMTLVPSLLVLAHYFSGKIPFLPTALRGHDSFFTLFVGAVSGQLAIALYRFICLYTNYEKRGWWALVLVTVISLLCIVPISLYIHLGNISTTDWFYSLFIAITSPFLFYLITLKEPNLVFPWEFRIQTLSTGIPTLIITIFYVLQAIYF